VGHHRQIYEHLIFGDHRFSSMPTLVPELADTCIVLNGVAKTYAMTGWRVGWMIGPSDVIQAATNLQSHTTSNVSNVAQRATLAAVRGDLEAVGTMREAFYRRGRTMHKMLSEIPGVTCLEPEGAFYCFPSLKGLLGHNARTTLELASFVLSEAKVAFVPERPSAPGYGRFSFALATTTWSKGSAGFNSCFREATERHRRPIAGDDHRSHGGDRVAPQHSAAGYTSAPFTADPYHGLERGSMCS
jgi:aspartate/methionine/tyrosine aminotransferase